MENKTSYVDLFLKIDFCISCNIHQWNTRVFFLIKYVRYFWNYVMWGNFEIMSCEVFLKLHVWHIFEITSCEVFLKLHHVRYFWNYIMWGIFEITSCEVIFEITSCEVFLKVCHFFKNVICICTISKYVLRKIDIIFLSFLMNFLFNNYTSWVKNILQI